MLIDSHCHLNLLTKDTDLDSVIQRAMANGVQYMQAICTKLEDLPDILQIAEKYKNVFASVGVHPCEVKQTVSVEEIIKLSHHPKIIGIGETGLDYYHTPYDKQQQKDLFVQHIYAASVTKLPIIVHTRDAEEDTIDILTSEMKNDNFPGLIHCFTSSKDLAKKMLDIGLYISMSGIITFKNATDLQEIVKYVPLERLLIETDSPYLAPTPMRGKQNEPAFVRYVAEKVAELKGITSIEVANATTHNFKKLFSKFGKYVNDNL
ncbi:MULTISPECIES: TatD family hydrolase [unclassified Rickettsia]|uniref:TatD family hydrolase n=1 Tax=unclassified Rickettsia TaxID=114295 RepID=UPI003132B407